MDDTERATTDPSDAAMMDSPSAVQARAHGASVVQVETLGKGGAIILWLSAFLSSMARALALFSMLIAKDAEREARLAQYETTLMRASFNASGLSTEDPITHEEQ